MTKSLSQPPKLKTLPKRHSTKEEGIFFKDIIDINKNNKVVDKIFLIRYREKEKDKLITIGKESEGIRITYVKNKRIEILNKIRLGEDPLAHKKKKNIISLNQLAKIYFDAKRCMICSHCNRYNNLSEQDKLKTSLLNKELNCDNRSKKHLLNMYNNHIAPPFGKENISQLNKNAILKFRQKLIGEKKANNTINGIIQHLSTIINYSIKVKELNIINPCVGIPKLKVDSDRQRYLTTNEIKKLLHRLRKDNRTLLFVKLSLVTGGRLKSILHIKKLDFQFERNTVSLFDFKNQETYTGFINDTLKKELILYTKELKSTDYIVGGKATPLSVNSLSRKLRPILNELFNIEIEENDRKNRTVIHSLRHTFASHLAINGTPIFNIQKLLNHKDIKMTMRYAKLAPDSGLNMVNALYK